jgi:hypothetical protein
MNKNQKIKKIISVVVLAMALSISEIFSQTTSTFEEFVLPLDTILDGSDLSGGYNSGAAFFPNIYDPLWQSWQGFIISTMRDDSTQGYDNRFSSITGGGYNSLTYTIGYSPSVIRLSGFHAGSTMSGFYITNSSYAYYAIKEGDFFSKKFGGTTGDDPDWFLLNIVNYINGNTSDTIGFYLADYRFQDNMQDYIIDTWEWVDLSALGASDSLLLYLTSSDTGAWGMNTPGFFCIDDFIVNEHGKFHPPAGQQGTSAIHKDSSVFVAWADSCIVTRGYKDISNPLSGYVNAGSDYFATGKAGENGVVSLGDSGYAVLYFSKPIINGSGYDFAVFENSFDDNFLELAFVEVSSDSINFFRFPATSHTSAWQQIASFGTLDATKINNLAGKYKALYGTPFDLEELSDVAGLDVNHIIAVKIIDVVGCIQPAYATYDFFGHIINDPWATPFSSGGFDLDAVGVIHQNETFSIKKISKNKETFKVFPTIVGNDRNINIVALQNNFQQSDVKIYNINGSLVYKSEITTPKTVLNLNDISAGLYMLNITSDNKNNIFKIILTQ